MINSMEGYRHRLLICWLMIALSSRQGNAFAPPPTLPAFGLSITRGRTVSSNVNIVESSGLVESPILAKRRRRLDMVGQVLDPDDSTAKTSSPIPTRTAGRRQHESLSPLEVWCLIRIEKWYSKALNTRCPFLRRRATDIIDALEMFVRINLIRREKLDLAGPEVSLRGDERTKYKIKNLNIEALAGIIRNDWKEDSNKGYYITGRLTPAIYRDDCYFDGPDPDMPVRGLRKFLNAASQLFDPKESVCELMSLEIDGDVVVADWKMNGVLRLPWKPKMPEVQGQTTYHFDEDGLVFRHEETWDLSAIDAFLKTAWFDFQFQVANTHNEELQEAEVFE